MIQKIKDKVYYKHQYEDKKIMYMAVIGIHLMILIVLFLGLGKLLNPIIASTIIVILYTFATLVYYFKIRGDKNRNYFKYNEFDTNYTDGACKFNPGSSKTSIQKSMENTAESKQRKEALKQFLNKDN